MSQPVKKIVKEENEQPQKVAPKNPVKSEGSRGKENNVIALPGMCMAESCKQKSAKANFCMEHFDWFKEGLITKEGRKPIDFEKKYYHYTNRLKKKAA